MSIQFACYAQICQPMTHTNTQIDVVLSQAKSDLSVLLKGSTEVFFLHCTAQQILYIVLS